MTNNGVIPRALALQEGLDPQAIHRLVVAGRWRRIHARAYVAAGVPLSWRTRLAAVQASLDDGFAFSHRTAGALLDLEAVPEGHVEIVTSRTPQLADVTVHRIRPPRPRIVHVEGFPVTSAQRTVLDLFSVLGRSRAELALEDSLRKKVTTIDRLWREYATTCTRGRNGCRSFRSALLRRDHRDGTLQSRMEAKLHRIIKKLPGAPAFPQFEVCTSSARYFIDFAFPDIKLGIEAMSIKWHMGEAKFYYDLKRDRQLKRVGWTMIYYAWDDLLHPLELQTEIDEFRRSLQRVLL